MTPEGQIIGLLCGAAASFGGGWWFITRIAQARHLLDTPTSKIRSAAQGYAEFYGVLVASEQPDLFGPLTQTPCLWWRYKIEEYGSSGKSRRWRLLESGSSEAWLLLQDRTGRCLIDPRGAEVRPATRQVWQGKLRHPLGPAKTGWRALFAGGKRYRYTEERLHVGQPLYAIGDFRSRGGGRQVFDLDAARAEVVRQWKGDFAGLLQRFDRDGNGQLDEQEWEHVRLAAKLEAEQQRREQSQQPVQHHLGKPAERQPFILSCAAEEELVRSLYWQAAGGALLCLVGALLVAVLNWPVAILI